MEVEDDEMGDGERMPNRERRSILYKKYGPWFIWGQLNAWYKQTVYDPTASLSAERRGTISLPDVECTFAGARTKYSTKVWMTTYHALFCLLQDTLPQGKALSWPSTSSIINDPQSMRLFTTFFLTYLRDFNSA